MNGRAWRVHSGFGFESLRLETTPTEAPGPGQVGVRVRAISLNYRDVLMVRGQYDPRMALPRIPLSDCAGTVEALGDGVTAWKVGDRVCPVMVPGWYAGEPTQDTATRAWGHRVDGVARDTLVVDARDLVSTPAHLTDAEAATLPCAAVTARHTLVGGRAVQPGDWVVVQGTGGVSLFALQLARLFGARVIVTSGSDAKLERALAMGATHGIQYRKTPRWAREVRALTGGVGADLVVEVGGIDTLAESLAAVRTSGQVSVIGVLGGRVGEVDLGPVLMRNLRLQGVFVGHRGHFLDLNEALVAHDVRPVVDQTFTLEALPAALAHLAEAGHFGKVVLTT